MEYNNRPLPSRKGEITLKLAEQCIVQEWASISLRLRLCLKILGPKAEEEPVKRVRPFRPFKMPLEAQVDDWSSRLNDILTQPEERRSLSSTVRQLRETLPFRNAIAHGEPGWDSGSASNSYILYYTLGRDSAQPQEQKYQALPPPRLELFPDVFLDPEDAELHSCTFDDMLEVSKNMEALRLQTEKLCGIALARHRISAS